MEEKHNIKRERVKTYFLDATKKVIINGGVEGVTVRKVADLAGYSYATIYNYFSDLNDLLWEAKKVMINDMLIYMQEKAEITEFNIDMIKKLFKKYIEYYLLNPNIFKFFYFYKVSKPIKQEKTEPEPDFQAMWKDTFKGFIFNKTLAESDIPVIAQILIYSTHGMLTLFFSGNGDLSEDQIFKDIDQIINKLLKK